MAVSSANGYDCAGNNFGCFLHMSLCMLKTLTVEFLLDDKCRSVKVISGIELIERKWNRSDSSDSNSTDELVNHILNC